MNPIKITVHISFSQIVVHHPTRACDTSRAPERRVAVRVIRQTRDLAVGTDVADANTGARRIARLLDDAPFVEIVVRLDAVGDGEETEIAASFQAGPRGVAAVERVFGVPHAGLVGEAVGQSRG